MPGAKTELLLFANNGNIGSLIVSLPFLRAVMRHFAGQSSLTVFDLDGRLSRSGALAVLMAEGHVRQVIDWPRRLGIAGWLSRWALLWRGRYAAGVMLEPRRRKGGRGWKYRLLCHSLGIRQFIGLRQLAKTCPTAGGIFHHTAHQRLHQAAASGIDIFADLKEPDYRLTLPTNALSSARGWLAQRRSHPTRPLLAICPGARAVANHWGFDRFAELGRRLTGLNRYELVVCGGPAERQVGDDLVAAWGQGLNAAGALSLLESGAVLAQATLMVGLDTGTTHLAAALGTPCIVVQGGRTPPGTWDPLGTGHRVLRHPVACAGCGLTVCPLRLHPCLRGITVERVLQALLSHPRHLEPHRNRADCA